MADGLNTARAMRVAEIMQDFKNIQTHIISVIRANAPAEEDHEEGFHVFRQSVAAAQQLLARPFASQAGGTGGDEEQAKSHLQRIILDACVRRFTAQKIYLRATAAARWAHSRHAILQGARPHAEHAAALQQIRHTLRSELASITDGRVEAALRQADSDAGKYIDEDPSLAAIQRVVGRDRG